VELFSLFIEGLFYNLPLVSKAIFSGKVSRLMLGEVGDLWDSVALVMYPSRQAMFKMTQDPAYQASAIHRRAGLDGQLNIEVKGGLGIDQL
jgi:uncharacterized protein (DUF1330 family)